MVASSRPKLRVIHNRVYRRRITMIVEREKTAQSTPRNTGPRFLLLAVVCNGLLSIARWKRGTASTGLGTALRGARRRTLGFVRTNNWRWCGGAGFCVNEPSSTVECGGPKRLPCRDLVDFLMRTNHG